jgi:hypothetical protein
MIPLVGLEQPKAPLKQNMMVIISLQEINPMNRPALRAWPMQRRSSGSVFDEPQVSSGSIASTPPHVHDRPLSGKARSDGLRCALAANWESMATATKPVRCVRGTPALDAQNTLFRIVVFGRKDRRS